MSQQQLFLQGKKQEQNFLVQKFQNLHCLQIFKFFNDSLIQFISSMPLNMQRFCIQVLPNLSKSQGKMTHGHQYSVPYCRLFCFFDHPFIKVHLSFALDLLFDQLIWIWTSRFLIWQPWTLLPWPLLPCILTYQQHKKVPLFSGLAGCHALVIPE